MKQKVIIALGGNALQNKGEKGTYEEAYKNVYNTLLSMIDVITDEKYEVVITHGNGPQVGTLMIQQHSAKNIVPEMPMFMCGAMTQGYIGYLLQQALKNMLNERGIKKNVSTVVTQVVVDAQDEGFKNPTKPVGSFYTKEEIEILQKQHPDYVFKEDAGRGYRRVVPSPIPVDIVEINDVRTLINSDSIVITSGGGGIPVVEKNNVLQGVDAVIDKDRAGALLAEELQADLFIILTAVDQVAINFGKENQTFLPQLTLQECETYMAEGHFAEGSMKPKIEAVMAFVKGNQNRKALITSANRLMEAMEHKHGTWIGA